MIERQSLLMLTALSLAPVAALVASQGPSYTIPGPEAEAWFGSALSWSNGGDASQCQQFIIGAPASDAMSPQRPGRAYVYETCFNGPPKLAWTFTGEANGDKFGTSVAGVGDLKGDGYAEWIIGAPGNDAGGAEAGRAYVYSGKSGKLLHIITGDTAGDWLGFSVAAVGDVDSDGVPDFAIGARNPAGAGYVRIYSGATFDVIHEFQGEGNGSHFGFALAGGGDVNGDGVGDIVVGAPFHAAPGFFGGRVYVFSGADGAMLQTFDGEASFNYFGTSVAIAGDVNGDGHADVLIGADGYSAAGASGGGGGGGANAGRAYVYSGKDGSLLHVFTGTEQRGRLGRGVSAVGDVNGDGRADLLVGQPSPLVAGGSGMGRAFVFSGMTGDVLREFVATEADDFFGFSVAGNPHAYRDQANVLIGAFASDINGLQSGRVDVFDSSESSLGDLNGDGVVNVGDLLILLGAWGHCPQSIDCPADLTGDDVVNVGDLLLLLANWG